MLAYCDEIIADHAAVHGWSTKQTNDVRRSLRLLHALQDTPGAKIHATDVSQVNANPTRGFELPKSMKVPRRTTAPEIDQRRGIGPVPVPGRVDRDITDNGFHPLGPGSVPGVTRPVAGLVVLR